MSTQENYLKGIADAIRAKTGESGSIQASQFATKISGIQTGSPKPSWVLNNIPAEKPNESVSWVKIAYGNGIFVMTTGYKGMYYSTDGVNWINGNTNSRYDILRLIYGHGNFLVCYSSYLPSSRTVDGINVRTFSGYVSASYMSIVYGLYNGAGRWIFTNYRSPYIYQSVWDSSVSSWTAVTSLSYPIKTTAYGNGKFVGFKYLPSGSNIAVYSVDGGDSWMETTLPVSAQWDNTIAYGNGKFVSIAYGTTNIVVISEDGINWTQGTMPVSAQWIDIAYGDGIFVALARNSDNTPTDFAAYSLDGITWTQFAMPKSDSWNSITFGDGMFVAVANNTDSKEYITSAYLKLPRDPLT